MKMWGQVTHKSDGKPEEEVRTKMAAENTAETGRNRKHSKAARTASLRCRCWQDR